MSQATSYARSERAFDRLSRGRQPLWHTVSCTCDDCIDTDAFICDVRGYLEQGYTMFAKGG